MIKLNKSDVVKNTCLILYLVFWAGIIKEIDADMADGHLDGVNGDYSQTSSGPVYYIPLYFVLSFFLLVADCIIHRSAKRGVAFLVLIGALSIVVLLKS